MYKRIGNSLGIKRQNPWDSWELRIHEILKLVRNLQRGILKSEYRVASACNLSLLCLSNPPLNVVYVVFICSYLLLYYNNLLAVPVFFFEAATADHYCVLIWQDFLCWMPLLAQHPFFKQATRKDRDALTTVPPSWQYLLIFCESKLSLRYNIVYLS